MKAYKKIMDGLAMAEKLLLCIISVVVTVITFANVCVRYLTDSQFGWSEEIVVNVFVLMIMCGCALCARDGSLISLTLVYDMVSKKVQKIFTIIITVVNCVFFGVVFKTGLDKVMTQMANGKRTFSLMIPEWIFSLALPIGAVLLIIHTVEYCITYFAKEKEAAGK